MINYDKIKKLNSQITINKEKLQSETDIKKKEELTNLLEDINTYRQKAIVANRSIK